MKDEDLMNQYLDGTEFNVRPNLTPPADANRDKLVDDSFEENDISLLVSPTATFPDQMAATNCDFDSPPSSKVKSIQPLDNQSEPNYENFEKNKSKSIDFDGTTTTPNKLLLDTSQCPSLGLGSAEDENETIVDLESPMIEKPVDSYVFKSSFYRNNDSEKIKDSNINDVEHTSDTLSNSKFQVSQEAESKKKDTTQGRTHEISDFKVSNQEKDEGGKNDEKKLSSSENSSLPQEEILFSKSVKENTEERRRSWNSDLSKTLAGVSTMMDSFEEARPNPLRKYQNPSADPENDQIQERSNGSPELDKKLHTTENSALSSAEKKNNSSSNVLSFFQNLLSPPKFLSPNQKHSEYKSIISNVRVKSDAEGPRKDNSDTNKNRSEHKSDNLGVGHWKLSMDMQEENNIKMNLSPISCDSSNSDAVELNRTDPNCSGEILGEKFLDKDNTSHRGLSRISSAYFSPVDSDSESSGNSTYALKDMETGSLEVSAITEGRSFNEFFRSQTPVYSGRHLSVEKMLNSSIESQTSPVTDSSNSNPSLVTKRGDEASFSPKCTSIRDLSSAKKKVDASSLALINRLQGASQRRKLLVSRAGESSEVRNEFQSYTSSKSTNEALFESFENSNKSGKEIKKTHTKSKKQSAFKPFKARPLPLTTSTLGHGGQLGVPRVSKKPPTNPCSPVLGQRRSHHSPSRAIKKVRAEEKSKKELLKSSFVSMPKYNLSNSLPKKSIAPREDPYIPFKARPIQAAPEPLRQRDQILSSIQREKIAMDTTRRKPPPNRNPYKPFKARPLPSASKGNKKVSRTLEEKVTNFNIHGTETCSENINVNINKVVPSEPSGTLKEKKVSKLNDANVNDFTISRSSSRLKSLSSANIKRSPLRGIESIHIEPRRKSFCVDEKSEENIGPNNMRFKNSIKRKR